MKRLTIPLVLVIGFVTSAFADDSPEDKLRKDPNDTAALNEYLSQSFRQLASSMAVNPVEAEKRIAAMYEFVGSLEPDTAEAKELLSRGKHAIRLYEQRIQLDRASLEQLATKLKENPDDTKTISLYLSKVTLELSPLARSDPERAEIRLNSAKQFVTLLKSEAKSAAAKQLLERVEQSLARVESSIESGKRLAKLVGADAAPLEAESWVNGSPLTDTDLKGKVVLLDFWAVWCGPCIATFPHLREWQEKYADQGLVMIGLTRYYNYKWDDAAARASRSKETVSPEQEQEMLIKFAEHHNLHHRFAIQRDRAISDYYAVTGIPHVVLIDREGKVRLIRVGSGEKNAQDISQMLQQLIRDQS